jgi:hypothetical protein
MVERPARLKALRRDLTDAAIGRHKGRIVKLIRRTSASRSGSASTSAT